jgi:hypothetical protein
MAQEVMPRVNRAIAAQARPGRATST